MLDPDRIYPVRLARLSAGPDSQLRTDVVRGLARYPELGYPVVVVASPLVNPEALFRRVATGAVETIAARGDDPNHVWFTTRSGSRYELEFEGAV